MPQALGFQGEVDYWAVQVTDHSFNELDEVVDSINSETIKAFPFNKGETYLCRLVSLDKEGRRYVWSAHRLFFETKWTISTWM